MITKEKILFAIKFNKVVAGVDFGISLFKLIVIKDTPLALFFFGLGVVVLVINKLHYKTLERVENE